MSKRPTTPSSRLLLVRFMATVAIACCGSMFSRRPCWVASAFSISSLSAAARRRGGVARAAAAARTVSSLSSFGASNRIPPNYVSSSRSRLFSTTSEKDTAASSSSSPVNATTTTTTTAPRVKTRDCQEPSDGRPVMVQGWVRTLRRQKTLAFLQVNDGSNLAGLQCVVALDDDSTVDENTLQQLDQVTTGAAVEVVGPLVPSQGGRQKVELAAQSLRVVGPCPADTYPLAKKRHSLEYLRTVAHLRPRTNTMAATARVRSVLAGAIHEFFQQQGFVYLQSPIITASDCEGAGELFRVTTLPTDRPRDLPVVRPDDDDDDNPTTDYTQDFFGKPAFLTVSGQLSAETHACALGDVYTFGPTFRAENSQTTRHLAEFHMVEPEMAFADLDTAMQSAEELLKYTVQKVRDRCPDDLQFFAQFYDNQLPERLERLVAQPFARCSYREAVAYLQEEIAKDPSQWQFPDVEFGTDLATEHERWLAEHQFGDSAGAVFVYNYPAAIKAFYMRANDADDGATVHAMDLLVPGVGELVGGSQREERLDVLEQKMRAAGLDPAAYEWYLDLRRFGTVPHAGYGLGFERLVAYVCGLENIRDAIAFPRYPGSAEF